jgi:acyl dehydratase
MSTPLRELVVGQTLGPIEHGPLTTRQLVEYAGASLDFNRIHYDEPFARAGGFPSVIAHGMLSMAFLGQLVAQLGGGPGPMRELRARFRAVAYPGDTLVVAGVVKAVRTEGSSHVVELELNARRRDGTVVLDGSAVLAE